MRKRKRKDSGSGFVVLFSPPCRCELCRKHDVVEADELEALDELLRDERLERDAWDGTAIGWRGMWR